jgi:uncharacterized protein YoxC
MTDLATLASTVSSLNDAVSQLSQDATDLFTETSELKTNVQEDIATAVSGAENAAIEPMIAMTSALALLSSIVVSTVTPEA